MAVHDANRIRASRHHARAGTAKIGNLRHHVGTKVADPLHAGVCLIEDGAQRCAFVHLDTASVSRAQVKQLRATFARELTVPPDHLLIAATHNHGGPAIVRSGDVPADAAYVRAASDAIVGAGHEALDCAQPGALGFGRAVVFDLACNRRVVLRDGTVRTHGSFDDPDALWIEGPIDPELHVIGARSESGDWLGCIVNFTCHPTDHGTDEVFSAGFPGVLARELRKAGVPVTLFFNGALGNVHPMDPSRGGAMKPMEEIGARLAEQVVETLPSLRFAEALEIQARSATVALPFRELTDDEVAGTVRGAQRYAAPGPPPADWPELYERMIREVEAEIEREGTQSAEVQAIALGAHVLVGIPAELFVELGLRIKEAAAPRRALVIGLANGMVGYVPHADAFARGGYETTLSTVSKLAPQAGDLLVEAATRALAELPALDTPATFTFK